jgi:RNA polymerase sigma-70 factor (ECF subfamily)
MVTALTRIFGVHNLALAEDVVQDAFCRALEVWKFRGVPENPSAWLMAVAKNRVLDVLRHEKRTRTFAPELGRLLDSEWTRAPVVAEMFSPAAIKDDQLRMMFSCCHPRLPEEAQVMLILHILCGFSVDEIANAFLSSHTAVEKRLVRAKKLFTTTERLFDVMAAAQFSARLPVVQRALYLLFNEGYHGASAKFTVRNELCREAIHLTAMLMEYPPSATPDTCALAALMCLNAARLPGRIDAEGNLISLIDQDRGRWDRKQIAEGLGLLEISATGAILSQYHVEAMIASIHARVARFEDTDWRAIVGLYDTLMAVSPSPVVALNRAIAIGQRDGPEPGLQAIAAITDGDQLGAYPFYFAAMGEFELRCGRIASARNHFSRAVALARNPMEQQFLLRRVEACGHGTET